MRPPEVTVVKRLVAVSVAVLLFAGAVSVFFKAGNNADTMDATATYATVLVSWLVFIGVSG
jgi:hypothetical protein